MYGNFEGFPQYWCILWVGDIVIPAMCYDDLYSPAGIFCRLKHRQSHWKHWDTVDGSEIRQSPVDMENLPLFTGFYTCRVVQNFFHQQQESIKHLQFWKFAGWLKLKVTLVKRVTYLAQPDSAVLFDKCCICASKSCFLSEQPESDACVKTYTKSPQCLCVVFTVDWKACKW